jgi:hypothetical protein
MPNAPVVIHQPAPFNPYLNNQYGIAPNQDRLIPEANKNGMRYNYQDFLTTLQDNQNKEIKQNYFNALKQFSKTIS